MKQKLITILVAFGIAKAQAEKYLEKVDAPDEAEFDTDKLLGEFRTSQAELLKNDKEFIQELTEPVEKKINDMWATKIKQATGLTAEEIKDKRYKEIVDLAAEKLRKKGDATSEELQRANLELENKLKDLTDNVLPAKDVEVANFKKNILKESAFEKMFDGVELGTSKLVAMAAVRAKMGNQFIDDLNDKNELEIYQSGEGKLKVKKKDGSGFYTAKELVHEMLAEEKLLKVSGGSGGEKKHPVVITGGGEEKKHSTAVQSGLDKARQNLEQVSNIQEQK